MNSPKTSYRPEVDGLRAIAVLSVIIYHAELVLRGTFLVPGGFLGVDIFFVISGYLITRLILAELYETGSFSFLRFYERRARRIMPMLLTVILLSVPFALYYLTPLPGQLMDYADSIIWSLLFSSNFFFYFSATQYAADAVTVTPFLHTWSLGVEEQFYLTFPIIAILLYRYMRSMMLSVFVLLLLISLQFADFMSTRNADLDFFLPMSRFWELLAGSIIAEIELRYGRVRNGIINSILPLLGLFMIIWSMFYFTDDTPHPGFLTVVPVAGSALIILFATQQDLAGKLLGSRAFVGVGLISYSAYLWHFPIFIFWQIEDPSAGLADKMIWIALTLVLSVLSYFLIEQPFRNRRRVSLKGLSLTLGGASVASLAIAAMIYPDISKFETLARTQPATVLDQRGYLKAWTDFKLKLGPTGFEADDKTRVLIVGDSHATDLYSALQQNAELFPGYDFAITHADNPGPRDSHYELYCFYWNFLRHSHEGCEGTAFSLHEKYRKSDIVLLATHWTAQDLEILDPVIQRLEDDGKLVTIVSNNLEIRDQILPVRQFINRHGRFPEEQEIRQLEQERYRFLDSDTHVAALNDALRNISERHGLKYLIKHQLYCDDATQRCRIFTPSNDILHWDYAHFTVNGAKFIGAKIAKLNWFP